MSLYFKSEEDTMKNEIPAAIFLCLIWELEKYNNNNFWVMKKIIIKKNNLITYWFPEKQMLPCSYISNHMLKIIHIDANHTDGCPI